MNLLINGENRDFETGTTIGHVLSQLELKPDRVVLELNRKILNAADSLDTELSEGNHLEIIQFVGGG